MKVNTFTHKFSKNISLIGYLLKHELLAAAFFVSVECFTHLRSVIILGVHILCGSASRKSERNDEPNQMLIVSTLNSIGSDN